MEKLNLNEKILAKLTQKYNIALLILFGSLSKNKNNEHSDIDLGIYLQEKISDKKEADLLVDFINLFQTDYLDISILNYSSPLLLFEVAKDGILLFESAKGTFISFKLKAFKQYWETRKFRDMRAKYLEKKLEEN